MTTAHWHHPVRRISLIQLSLLGGGVARVGLTLARALVDAGHEVDLVVVTAKGEMRDLLPANVRLVDLGCDRYRSVPLAIARYLRRTRPDAVIANTWPLTVMCAIGHSLARSGSRLALVEHVPLSPWPAHRRWRGRLSLRASLALACRLADVCIAVSSGLADEVGQLAGLGRDRPRVIHNPVEMPPAAIEETPGYLLWGGSKGSGSRPKRLLAVGRLRGEKNHALLLDAFARLIETVDARLVILGDGPLREALERRIAELGLGDVVRLPGFLPDPWPAYAAADLFVLSSDYEGFGNVLVEAMAVGLPVVSTDCPTGPREVLGDGTFGTLVPCGDAAALADAMRRALSAEHDCDKLKARAREFAPARAAEAYLRAIFGPGGA